MLTPGNHVGPYEILALLGAGGMGEVYKARDTRLGRDVAIKVLPAEFTSDPGRLQRFEQEARTAGALNHPNIVALYDVGTHDGAPYLVTELLEGQSLAQRIRSGDLTVSRAVELAVQIAAGLAAAHSKGIVHRDLKPENLFVTSDGVVKILDFGLAKLKQPERAVEEQALAETSPVVGTASGLIMGTAPYMSPEQARGLAADARSDIFSFGCVLYEMLSAERAFRGDTASDVMAAILKEDPAPLPGGVPPALQGIVSRCLEKRPEDRFDSAHDVALALQAASSPGEVPRPQVARHLRRARLVRVWMILLAVAVTAVGGWLWLGRSRPSMPEEAMTTMPLVTYPGKYISGPSSPLRDPSFSPDGNEIVFAWSREGQSSWDIYRKMIGQGEPLRLTTDPAADVHPVWSPDGRFIAFLRWLESGGCAVCLVPALGGAERRIAKIQSEDTLAWSPDGGWLLVSDGCPLGLHLVSVETGEKIRLTSPPPSIGDLNASFSPDGTDLAFVRMDTLGVADLYRLRLAGGKSYAGEPERLTHENRYFQSPVWTRDGREILYSDGAWDSSRVVRRISLAGQKGPAGYRGVQQTFGEDATELAISPVGRRLAYTHRFMDDNIYRLQLPGKGHPVGVPERLIASTRMDQGPQYSPDGGRIAFVSTRSGTLEIWVCDADGANPRQLTSMGGPLTDGPNWSPDGQTIAFKSRKDGRSHLYLVSAQGGPARRVTTVSEYEGSGPWSRDGRWIYFDSGRTGFWELYRVSTAGGEAVQVTKNGGDGGGFESIDGQWLYYDKFVEGWKAAIWRMPLGGGEGTEIHPGPLGLFKYVDDGVYLLEEDGTLGFFSFADRRTTTVAKVKIPSTPLDLTVSPDRRWILVTLMDQTINELILVENFR